MITKMITEIGYDEWEDLVFETYGIRIEITAEEEWGNYQMHSTSGGKEALDKYDQENIDKWINNQGNGGPYYGIFRHLTTDMINKGVLPEVEEYIIDVSW